jgi:hypothetical protein
VPAQKGLAQVLLGGDDAHGPQVTDIVHEHLQYTQYVQRDKQMHMK